MMKFFKKAAVVTLSVAMVTTLFAGCSSKKKDDKTWVIGTNAEFAPFEYVSKKDAVINDYAGIDIEIIKKIAEDNGKKIKINNMEFDSLIVALKNKQVDGVIAGMTVTDERKEEVDFSEPYYVAKQVMIVKEDNTDIKTAKDMEKKTIAIQELNNGKCDVVVIDSATANQYVKDNKGLKIVEDDEAFASEEYAIAVQKGDKKTLEKINASIKKFKEDGTIDTISAKYASSSDSDSDTEEK